MWSVPFSMVTTFLVSYLFEIWGRRITLVISYVLSAGVFFILPYSAPDYNMLMVMRCLIAITMSAPLSHPLIADYVKRTSRGKAIALAGVGIILGEVFSMGILFNLTKSMNYYDAFAIAASLIFMFALFFMFSLKEPDFEHIRDN
jgi:MFS family permease